jgi:D-glycero-D-manno-heptose 1,7-bisphosphate phosphatase
MNKCVFLDRDGVINEEIGRYVYKPDEFKLMAGLISALKELKKRGYLLVIITNQAGIAKSLYDHKDVQRCHEILQGASDNCIDAIYYSPYHPDYTESLGRKPGRLLFEKAIAKFNIYPEISWMIGDKERDLVPAKSLGIKTLGFGRETIQIADFHGNNWQECLNIIK